MGYVILVLVAIFLSVCISRGSWKQIQETRFHWPFLIVAALLVQSAAGILGNRPLRAQGPASALLLASYVLLIAFCVANLRWVGIWIIMAGLSANALAIGINGGMPTRTPSKHSPIARSVKHRTAVDSDQVSWLTDVIWVPKPFSMMISAGDVMIAVGCCGVAFATSRRAKPDALARASTD